MGQVGQTDKGLGFQLLDLKNLPLMSTLASALEVLCRTVAEDGGQHPSNSQVMMDSETSILIECDVC